MPAARHFVAFLRLLLSGAWLLLFAALAAPLSPAYGDPQVALEEARSALAQGRRDAAIAALERAVAEDANLALAHRWLSRLYAEKGLREKALDSLAAALLLEPTPADKEQLARLLDDGFPDSMALRTPDAVPVEKTRIAVEVTGDRLAETRGPSQALFFLPDDRDSPARDPKSGWSFDRASYGYSLDPASSRWHLSFVVHYSSVAGAEGGRLALNCMGLLLRAACAQAAHLGPSGHSGAPAHLWLCDRGEPGGETWGDNMYLFSTATAREPGEWLRQVIHEHGHAALPGVDSFTEPEPWANGRLGEHLFSRWLAQAPQSGPAHPWLAEDRLKALADDADRCIGIFLQAGPASALMTDRGRAGMDYYLGFADYVEQAFGSKLLAAAMGLTAGHTCQAFAVGVQEALRREAAGGIELRAAPAAPAGAAHWVYLPAGAWRAACRAGGGVPGRRRPAAAANHVEFNGRRIGEEETDVGRIAGGWHAVTLPPGAIAVFRRQ